MAALVCVIKGGKATDGFRAVRGKARRVAQS